MSGVSGPKSVPNQALPLNLQCQPGCWLGGPVGENLDLSFDEIMLHRHQSWRGHGQRDADGAYILSPSLSSHPAHPSHPAHNASHTQTHPHSLAIFQSHPSQLPQKSSEDRVSPDLGGENPDQTDQTPNPTDPPTIPQVSAWKWDLFSKILNKRGIASPGIPASTVRSFRSFYFACFFNFILSLIL